MERLCFLLELVEGSEEEYDQRHRDIWPEMTAALDLAGYTNYTIFRHGTTVIGYAECVPDVATVTGVMAAHEVTPRWNESFEGVIRTMVGVDGAPLVATEVWRLHP